MRYSVIVVGFLVLVGCSSRVPLTKGLIKDYGLVVNDITKLQLYVSDGVLLEKRMKKIDKNIDSQNYSLKKVEDYYVKQIYFAKGTPCVATSAALDNLAVAFEQPGDNLEFVTMAHGDDEPFTYRPDKRLPHDTVKVRPSAAGFANWKTIGEETYADTMYTVLIDNHMPILIVDKTSLKNFILESRRVKGLKQNEIIGR